MTTYTYIVKCADYEDEFFDFFEEAKEFALSCMSKKPIITQTEVERNDFGECTDHCDLGTVWSWEDVMKDTCTDDEPAKCIFTKDDLKDYTPEEDSEFNELDNSVECTIEETPLEESVADNLQPGVVYTLKDDAFVCEAEDSSIKGFLSNPNATAIAHVKNTYTKGDDIIIPAKSKLRYVKDYQVNNINYQMFSDGKVVFLFSHSFANHLITEAVETRKPIPEGMTIKQLVEEMEENEDEVECTWCNELFGKDQCRYEVDLGWLCSRCEAAIKSRGETLTFKENNYWDFLDEKLDIDFSNCIDSSDMEIWGVEPTSEATYKAVLMKKYEDVDFHSFDATQTVHDEMLEIGGLFVFYFDKAGAPCLDSWNPELLRSLGNCEIIFDDERYDLACEKTLSGSTSKTESLSEEMSLADLVKDSISHLTNDLGKDPWVEDFADEVIGDLERNYENYVPEDFAKYQEWCSAVACEVSRQVNKDYRLDETLDPAGKPDLPEISETSDSHLALCPECGKDAFDTETGICINCGFN